MKNSKTRLFEYDGRKVMFDRTQFCFAFDSYRQANKIPVIQLEERIAETVFLSREAVHNWRNGYNGPSDIPTIQSLAAFLKVSPESLLADYKEENRIMNHFTESQLESAKRLTDGLWDYIYMFSETEGFTTHIDISTGEQFMLSSGNDYQDEYYDKLSAVFRKEYFTLHGCEFYAELEILLNDISSSYDSDYRYLSESEIDNKAIDMYPKYVRRWTGRLIGTIKRYLHSDTRSARALNDRQLIAFKRLYDEILDCIDRIRTESDGNVVDHEMFLSFQMDYIDNKYKQESFDLMGLELYNDFDGVIDSLNEWVDILRYGNSNGNDVTESVVRKKLLSLVDKYN